MEPKVLQLALAFILLPERTDFFALPTSAALTGWDAALIMLPAGLALTAAVAGALPPTMGARIWKYRHVLAIEGVLFLWFNHERLSLLLAALAVLATAALIGWLTDESRRASEEPALRAPSALWQRLGELFYGIAFGSALAAVIKVILPTIDVPAAGLPLLGTFAGLLLPLSPAIGAIPALALAGLDGGLLAGALWLVASMLRQVGVDSGRSWLPAIARYLYPSQSGR